MPPGPPLLVRQGLDRFVGLGNAGIEEDIKVDAAHRDDPEQQPAERAELPHGIALRTEDALDAVLEHARRARAACA